MMLARSWLIFTHHLPNGGLLAYVLIRGTAVVLPPDTTEQQYAVTLLRARYVQYQAMPIDMQPVIAIRPQSVVVWGTLLAE